MCADRIQCTTLYPCKRTLQGVESSTQDFEELCFNPAALVEDDDGSRSQLKSFLDQRVGTFVVQGPVSREVNTTTLVVYNGAMVTREKKQWDVGNPGTQGLVPGDGLLLICTEGGTFRSWSGSQGDFFSTQTVQLNNGTPLIVVDGDPGTIGVVAIDHLGRRVIVTHVDILVGVVVALSRGGKQTGET